MDFNRISRRCRHWSILSSLRRARLGAALIAAGLLLGACASDPVDQARLSGHRVDPDGVDYLYILVRGLDDVPADLHADTEERLGVARFDAVVDLA